MKNAGFTIIATETKPYGEGLEGIALGHKVTIYGEEWVTWAFTHHPAEERSYFWGHYFTNEETAKIDYHQRILKMYGEE